MNIKNGNSLVVVLAGALVILATLAAFLFIQNQALETKLSSSSFTNQVVAPKEMVEEVTEEVEEESIAPSAEPTPTPVVEKVEYFFQSSWQTYTDNEGKFSIQYPPYEKIAEATPGKGVGFFNCNTITGKEICLGGDRFTIFDDYDGGSRRAWFSKKYGDFASQTYMQDLNVQGINALVVMDGNTSGSTGSWVLIPRGKKMYVFASGSGWNPETGDKSALKSIKEKLSTLKFF